MRVYFNLLICVLGLGSAALALAAQTVGRAAPGGVRPLVALGALALLALGAGLLSGRSARGDLGRAWVLLLLGGAGAWLAGRLELGPPLYRAWGVAALVVLPPLGLALSIALRSSAASAELVRELIESEGALENTLLALSLLGPEALTFLADELEASPEGPRRARCLELLGAFPRNGQAAALAEAGLDSATPEVREAAQRALERIAPEGSSR